MKHFRYTFALVVLLSVGSRLNAQQQTGHFQIPNIISYQGFLSTDTGAFNGSTVASLFLFDDPSSGNQVWSEAFDPVIVNKGYYTLLMDVAPESQHWTSGSRAFDKPYWLRVQINGQEMKPRIQLTATPYAMTARIADSAVHVPSQTPVGTIMAYGGSASSLSRLADLGWAVCDGTTISKSDYPDYYNICGDIYGSNGNDVYLPDLRGVFLRGVNSVNGQDRSDSLADVGGRFPQAHSNTGGNSVGTLQMDAFQGHYHNIGVAPNAGNQIALQALPNQVYGGGPFRPADYLAHRASTPVTDSPDMSGQTAGPSGWPRFTRETRPKNASVYWIIKIR